MLKILLIILCLSTVAPLIISMESEEFITELEKSATNVNAVFSEIAQLIKTQQDEGAIEVLSANQDLWPILFFDLSDEDGNNLLHLAFINHCYEMIGYLLSNNFPTWRLNSKFESIYEVKCTNETCSKDCPECFEYLPKQNINNISRYSIINRGGNLNIQFKIAQKYNLEKKDLENLIEDLVNAHQFTEAEELIKSNNYLDLQSGLISTISIWKKYPRNAHIDELVQTLLSKFADNKLMDNDLNKIFRNHPTLREKYDNFIAARNRPTTPTRLHKIKPKNFINNKSLVIGLITIFTGLVLLKTFNRNAVPKKLSKSFTKI